MAADPIPVEDDRELMKQFALALRASREAAGWSQDEAARRVGVTVRTYAAWELAEKEVKLSGLEKAARAYGWTWPFRTDQPTDTRMYQQGQTRPEKALAPTAA